MAHLLIYHQNNARVLQRERVFRDRTQQLDILCDQDLLSRYRMPRHAIADIVNRVRGDIEHETKRSSALSPETQVLVALRYLSKGGFLMEIGDLHGVSEASVSRCLHATVSALCLRLPQVFFPTQTERTKVKQGFYEIAHFPRVVGAIDGTLIPIKRPHREVEVGYVCRKGFHAINVQAVCDADLRFTNVVAKWPGSCHDATIFSTSPLCDYLERHDVNGWLLGDSGYGCKSFLLTPINNPQTPAEERYNHAHIKTRNTIERAFGLLKSRFRCLHKSTGCLQFEPAKCTKIIMATFLLHNFCLGLGLPDPEIIQEDDHQDIDINHAAHQGGIQIRRQLIDNVFN